MSGRAISLVTSHMSGIRVASKIDEPSLVYVPAYIKNGKKINQKITIPVIANSHKGGNGEGRADAFKLVAWGKLADICARSCSPGKALDVSCDIQSYSGNVFDQSGQLRLDATGQPIQVTKISFTIKDIVFGEEADKFIQDEIQRQKRPANWDKKGHPDFETWRQKMITRQSAIWDGKSNTFGFARVFVPQGVQLDLSQPAQTAQPAQQSQTAQPLPEEVRTAINKMMQQFAANNMSPAATNPAPVAPVVGESVDTLF